MSETYDFVDINKKIIMSPEDIYDIEKNPRRLTKEGVKKKIELWNQSNNKYLIRKYKLMLEKCKNFSESGKVKRKKIIDGKEVEETFIIFQRDKKGNPTWVGKLEGDEEWSHSQKKTNSNKE